MRTLPLLSLLVFAPFAFAGSAPSGHIKHVPSSAFRSIQTAIEASESGDAIVVAPGTYFESLSFIGKSHVELRGSAATILDSSGFITGIKISNSDHIRVHGFRIITPDLQLVRIEASTVVTVDHCTLEGGTSGSDGFVVSASDQTTIKNNTLTGSLGIAINLLPGTAVVNSVIKTNKILGPSLGGIFVSGGHNLVDSNKIGLPGNVGIVVDSDSDGTTLRHNFITAAVGDGIVVNGPNCLVDKNSVQAPSKQGIRIAAAGAKLNKNFIDEPQAVGIEIQGNGCISSGNRVRNAETTAIHIAGSNGVFASEKVDHGKNDCLVVDGNANTILNCHFATPGDDGIEVDGNANILTNCSATHAKHRGFSMDGNSNIVTGCHASGSASFDLFEVNGQGTSNIYTGCSFPNANITFGNDND